MRIRVTKLLCVRLVVPFAIINRVDAGHDTFGKDFMHSCAYPTDFELSGFPD